MSAPGRRVAPRPVLALALAPLAACAAAGTSRQAPPPPPEHRGLARTVAGDLGAAPSRLWTDAKETFGSRGNLVLLGAAGLFALGQEHLWEDEEADFFERHTLFGRDVQDALGMLGNGWTLYAGALTWYFVALGRGDVGGYADSKTVLSAMTITSLSTHLLKSSLTDGRPGGGTHDFPSGHASLSMSVAASLDQLYGHAWGIPAYALSGLIGLQRLDTGKHDTGAVVFGWTLGYVIGRTVAADEPPIVLGMELAPWMDPDTGAWGFSLSRRF